MKPLAIDLFCGLGGWSDGLIAEGYEVVGYDIEAHEYGDMKYPGKMVIQDVLTLHGSQFKDAALIVASPPCQEYSYMAMPWKLAKAKAAAIRADTTGESLVRLNRLFNACFRIQAEASLAAGRLIPMIVENVRGAQPWVGRARFNFGSFYLWGDVPALMPITRKAAKVPGFRFDGSGKSFQTASVEGLKEVGPKWDSTKKSGAHGMKRWTNPSEGFKTSGMNWSDRTIRGQDFTRIAENQAVGTKVSGDWFGSYAEQKAAETISPGCLHGKGSVKRKAASAMIAKIPLPLARYIGATFRVDAQQDRGD